MAARVERVELDDPVGVGECLVRRILVAVRAGIDVVVFLALLLVPDDRCVVLEGLLGRRDHRQRLVVDVDQLDRVLRDVDRLCDDGRDLLSLEAHLVRGEHGLGVA